MNLVRKAFRASVGCSFSEPGTEGPQVCSERVMSFIRTAVFSQPGGAAWALGHAQPFAQPGKRWWKYFQQSVDCVNQDLNQLPGAVIQVGWERLVHLHAEWMRFVCCHKEIQDPWVSGWCETPEIDWKALGNHLCLGPEPRHPYLCPHPAAPTEDNLQVSPGVGELAQPAQLSPWLSVLCFHKWMFSARKMFPAIFFFPLALLKHCAFLLLASQLVPALPLVHTKSSLRHGEGMPRHSCSKLVYIRKKTNPKTFLQIKSLFSMERLELIFT